ncbi:PLP-dependent transferase [Rhizobium multihospitium]|uniref:PLP-dependent transferase n=1 Tax=Rhizobium multihospitium TaxID=410764 RepID=UPI00114CFDAB|nr:PLP-dependent transferase [Rhizobium multihospitium]
MSINKDFRTMAAANGIADDKAYSAITRRAVGIGDGLLRVSVGLEAEEDLLSDFAASLG